MSIASRIQKETLKWTPEDMIVLKDYAMKASIGLSAIESLAPEGIAAKSFEIAEQMMVEYQKQKARKILIAATNPGIANSGV